MIELQGYNELENDWVHKGIYGDIDWSRVPEGTTHAYTQTSLFKLGGSCPRRWCWKDQYWVACLTIEVPPYMWVHPYHREEI